MCGRYTANTEDEVIEIRGILAGLSMRLSNHGIRRESDLAAEHDRIFTDIYGKEIFPSGTAPVITNSGDIILSKWGFDKWDGKGLVINARSETAGSSRFFSPYAQKSRCIIPASHYFEWKKEPKQSAVKYRLGVKCSSGIYMAGLLNKEKNNYVIMTKQAAESIGFIHDRMPVLLLSSQVVSWLNGTLDLSALLTLMPDDIYYETA